jgi:CxxC-x17-CxxC domain-containing protein
LIYNDVALTCRQCGKPFTFTESEQEAFTAKGHNFLPGRCGDCRAARKAARGNQPETERSMMDRGPSERGSGHARGPREMFSTICSECGQTAIVPFQPRTDKPVYCSNCFEFRRGHR